MNSRTEHPPFLRRWCKQWQDMPLLMGSLILACRCFWVFTVCSELGNFWVFAATISPWPPQKRLLSSHLDSPREGNVKELRSQRRWEFCQFYNSFGNGNKSRSLIRPFARHHINGEQCSLTLCENSNWKTMALGPIA